MEKSSHEGTKMSEACGHLKKMHREHGHPDHMGARKPENENRENRRMERGEELAERKDG